MKNKNNKGFTLVEVIAVVIILGITLTTAIVGYIKYIRKAKLDYYQKQEDLVTQAGRDYFNDNRGRLPINIGEESCVTLKTLIDYRYISNVLNYDKKPCNQDKSKVCAHKIDLDKYKYVTILSCGEDYNEKTYQDPTINFKIKEANKENDELLNFNSDVTIGLKKNTRFVVQMTIEQKKDESDKTYDLTSYDYVIHEISGGKDTPVLTKKNVLIPSGNTKYTVDIKLNKTGKYYIEAVAFNEKHKNKVEKSGKIELKFDRIVCNGAVEFEGGTTKWTNQDITNTITNVDEYTKYYYLNLVDSDTKEVIERIGEENKEYKIEDRDGITHTITTPENTIKKVHYEAKPYDKNDVNPTCIVKSNDYKIDKVKPVCETRVSNNSEWTKENVEVNINCSDEGSKCRENKKKVVIKDEYIGDYVATVSDKAGNTNTCPPARIRLDKTDPVIRTTSSSENDKIVLQCSDNGDVGGYYFGSSMFPTEIITNEEELKLLKTTGLTKDLLDSGNNYFTCIDKAGNYATKKINLNKVTFYSNLLYNQENFTYRDDNNSIGPFTSAFMKYTLKNGVYTVTATNNDGYGVTTAKVDLVAGKKYIFNCDTDGLWNDGVTKDTVEAFLLLNGAYNNGGTIKINSNKDFEFVAPITGTYSLRLDVNENGKTHKFSNITITEGSNTRIVDYDAKYGTLPTSKRTGHTFSGWTLNIAKTAMFRDEAGVRSADGTVVLATSSTDTVSNYMATTDLIPVKGGVTLYTNIEICGIYSYDALGNSIKRESSYTTTHPISENAAFIRIEIRKDAGNFNYYKNNLILSEFEDTSDIPYINTIIDSSTVNKIDKNHSFYPVYNPYILRVKLHAGYDNPKNYSGQTVNELLENRTYFYTDYAGHNWPSDYFYPYSYKLVRTGYEADKLYHIGSPTSSSTIPVDLVKPYREAIPSVATNLGVLDRLKNGDVTVDLYGGWKLKPVYVYYHVNGGTPSGSYKTKDNFISTDGKYYYYYSFTNDTNLHDVETFGLTRAGYTKVPAKEWCTGGNGTGTCFNENTNYAYSTFKNLATDQGSYYKLIVYANWKLKPVYVYYHVNGGTPGGSFKKIDNFISTDGKYYFYYSFTNDTSLHKIETFGLTRTGYTKVSAKEWCTGGNGTGTCFNENTNYSFSKYRDLATDQGTYYRLIVYANWKQNSTPTTTYYTCKFKVKYCVISPDAYYAWFSWDNGASGGNCITADYNTGHCTVGTVLGKSISNYSGFSTCSRIGSGFQFVGDVSDTTGHCKCQAPTKFYYNYTYNNLGNNLPKDCSYPPGCELVECYKQ